MPGVERLGRWPILDFGFPQSAGGAGDSVPKGNTLAGMEVASLRVENRVKFCMQLTVGHLNVIGD